MGLEYHDRRRDLRGRFDRRHRKCQVHVYMTDAEWRALKLSALMACEELSTYCRRAALERARRDLESRRSRQADWPQ